MIIDFNATIGDFPEGKKIRARDILNLMDRADIDKAVVSTAGTYSDIEEIDFLCQQTKSHTDRLIPFAIVNPKLSDSNEIFVRICDYGFQGIRFAPVNHGYFPSQCHNLDAILAQVAKARKIVSITTGVTTLGDPAQWLPHIRRWQKIHFVLLGMGAFDFGYGCVDYALQLPNIYLETSLQYEIQIINKAIQHLQGNRIIFGSGIPVRIPEIELLKIKAASFSKQIYEKITYSEAQNLIDMYKEGCDE